jgi:hypothetical protein
VLRAHCEAERRNYDAIRKTAVYPGPVLDDPVAFLATIVARLAEF